jgi:hypothetical protein
LSQFKYLGTAVFWQHHRSQAAPYPMDARKDPSCLKIIHLHLFVVSISWSNCQSSWLRVERSGFDSWRYQIFWEVVGLEWGPLSRVSATEELTEWYV